ncbi:SRPBCC family protein [Paucibacter sp. O1-1]|uniref:SRPBCC family protein n=1 Tax=Paucibacter sp. M5-1 TaxID=3015998 RepID=UPI0021D519C2|nr:SRPBCC family protein [Paucibacter sp. M5-1]MCU7374781.1 SRPBCC family protein [Paucibacter sp. O1-1]MCZ7881998.1 SRPBCC family protein [Paucibacter sp. M5-1]MDA3829783.1 SRPBCC family protein [Paucibacter sp. O1-1]
MIKTIALVIVAALALLLIYAATRPDSFRVERSTRIQAPPEKIYALIHDLKGFNRWNPYEKKDPAIKGQYSAVTAGPGARYGWESDKVGVGSMEITEVAAPSRVAMKLDFVKPFEAHNQVEFRLRPEGGATQVSWAMQGPSPFVSKLIGVFISMDRMIGQDFEDGLANLKSLAEQH